MVERFTETYVYALLRVNDRLNPLPEHWIHGYDEGLSYCRTCAQKKIDELRAVDSDSDYLLDGGWPTESDGLAFCESCYCPLHVLFTDYAVDSELQYFSEYGFSRDNIEDWYSLQCIVDAAGITPDVVGLVAPAEKEK